MEVSVTAVNNKVSQKFNDYVENKSSKVSKIAVKARKLEVKLTKNDRGSGLKDDDRIELTLIGLGQVIRAEAAASEKYSAFDLAFAKLLERVRRWHNRYRNHPHRSGGSREMAAGSLDGSGFGADGHEASAEHAEAIEEFGLSSEADSEFGDKVPIRVKQFPAEHLSDGDAVHQMELLGHDFFVYLDKETNLPSVAYRRRGWSYGVVRIETEPGDSPS